VSSFKDKSKPSSSRSPQPPGRDVAGTGEQKTDRRSFLLLGLAAAAGIVGSRNASGGEDMDGMDMGGGKKLIKPDGKPVQADTGGISRYGGAPVPDKEVRRGMEGRKFVMVIDLAACDGCAKCTTACQAMHHIPSEREWIKVFRMKDGGNCAPYWLPRPCFHCDNPPCTKVCPVNATFKREDGIVLVDNNRCIGCRFCMAACPYSARFFNWDRPEPPAAKEAVFYSPERGFPRRIGTVEKCDFCPDMARMGKLPDCAAHCPMGTIYFGDQNEDAVTNSKGETVRFSEFVLARAAYRYMEELGTEPRVYYLPPKGRMYPPPGTLNGR
jgi:Fe-S-cluster-containing dehydrogenase component